MATPFLCANDAPFDHLNHARAPSTQYAGIEALLDQDLCNERLLQLNGLQSREDNAIAWENPACPLQYGFIPSEWTPSTHETYASPRDQEESAFSDCSLDTFTSDSSYTWGPPQSEEPEPESTNLPRLSCRKCYRKFENAYSLEQHAKASGHRIFVCPILGCDMSYTRRDSWTRHKRSHNLELRCDLCPEGDQKRTFKRKDHLLTHQRNCHPQACGSPESSSMSRPLQPTKAPNQCSCACSKGSGTASSNVEARATLEDIVEIKREHQDRRQVLRALKEKFDLKSSSTTEDFASILADLVTSQAVKPEP